MNKLNASLVCFALVALISCQACMRAGNSTAGILVVNAPAQGQIVRVLAREGMEVTEGQPIAEIAIDSPEPTAAPTIANERQLPGAARVEPIQTQIDAARSEVVRLEVEVQRMTTLVAAGQASQPDLDAARALSQRAQQRLQSLKTAQQQGQSRQIAERANNSPSATATPAQQIAIASASSAGTVAALSARVGDRVKTGQPLATIRVAER